ncbi:hypothetical protein PTSG_09554 [Salpingoeca rosetta]|uniref:Arp2/3 complex 34 kDa subunit n=1 Tax=Salpingoeca rosetta (strain ATCC 50818 / BSB-021) TaxID=946362 RepID=F2ULC0_SALR5|nr:uncharacterized protein PTSG_09554 [Salpingoeca rosetta]EGD77919.1 hypothetical protein PTSG_09554 [Salpingoeca rosetta]|eukprot:XP_004989983.1 hypothetical protein PTSG_09554 [Salpingoeca rosetta]
MILLEVENRILSEVLSSRASETEEIAPVDMTVADFDGTMYHVSNPEGDATKVLVSISVPFFHQLQQFDVDSFMKGIYGDMVTSPESGYDFSLLVDISKLGANPEVTISNVARLRRNCFAAVFTKFFQMQKDGKMDSIVLNYKEKETMFINAMKDRVTVIFSTLFTDKDDIVIGKVFMKAFQDVRGRNPSAPQVLFGHAKDVPRELEGTSALTGDNVGYVTFVLFPRHISDDKMDHTIDLIHTFRDYLHYHIKCSKAYLHQRMRARTSSLLKVLNRARPDAEKEKKTATGRTFVRK